MIYLDSNATTRPTREVVAAALAMLETQWHNPSSIHRPGQAARGKVELARRAVARLLNSTPGEVILMSGGTESINAAIRGAAAAGRAAGRRAIVSTGVEHHAVSALCKALAASEGMELRLAPVDEYGVVEEGSLADVIDESVALVSIQWANNETGAIQPVEAIGERCRQAGAVFHCDGTQWVGKMPTDVTKVQMDLLTLSAHKFHGPKGAGAMYLRKGLRLSPLFHGSQEQGRRGGTENTSGIVGMGVACDQARAWLADPANMTRCAQQRDRFEREVIRRAPGARVNGPTAPGARLWNTTNIAFPEVEAEMMLLTLSEAGVCASGGSACASGSIEPSPVLCAMGCDPGRAIGSVRFSLSRETTDAEIDGALDVIERCWKKLAAPKSAAASV